MDKNIFKKVPYVELQDNLTQEEILEYKDMLKEQYESYLKEEMRIMDNKIIEFMKLNEYNIKDLLEKGEIKVLTTELVTTYVFLYEDKFIFSHTIENLNIKGGK